MEAKGFKQRLKEAKINSEKIKIFFLYPSSAKPIVKKGVVLSVNEDSFDFQDRYDGELTFSYDYIVEIGGWNDGM